MTQLFTPNTWRSGDSYVICEICGLKRFRSDMSYNYKKQLVCSDTCWEARNPQDFVKNRVDKVTADDGRAEPSDVYLDAGEVTADDL